MILNCAENCMVNVLIVGPPQKEGTSEIYFLSSTLEEIKAGLGPGFMARRFKFTKVRVLERKHNNMISCTIHSIYII